MTPKTIISTNTPVLPAAPTSALLIVRFIVTWNIISRCIIKKSPKCEPRPSLSSLPHLKLHQHISNPLYSNPHPAINHHRPRIFSAGTSRSLPPHLQKCRKALCLGKIEDGCLGWSMTEYLNFEGAMVLWKRVAHWPL